jgi:tetratricopeptide (TPR) repeat protein
MGGARPSPDSRYDFLARAEDLRRRGRVVEALSACRAGLASVPAFHSARALLGRLLLETGDPAAARAELHLVLGRSPRHLAARRTLAQLLAQCGETADAAEAAEAARRLAPRDAALRAALDRLLGPSVPPPVPPPVASTTPAASQARQAAEGDAISPLRSRRAGRAAALERWLDAVRRACPDTLPDAS